MKRLLNSKKFIQKMLIAIIIALLLSFTVPIKSQAGIGGLLLDPLFDLTGTILDAVIGLLQMCLVDGEFNNSEDGSMLNLFMIDPDELGDPKYSEFQASSTGNSNTANVPIKNDELDTEYYIPALKYTPEKIFTNQIPALDINFVNPKPWEDPEMNKRSITQELQGTIASWYVGLRNLSVVGLMLVLVYIGIRIVISSTASDKSKYKQMLMDWLIALCLVFCMHYIMSFTTTIVTEISEAITGTDETNHGNSIIVEVEDGTTFRTDLMGLIRFRMQSPTVGLKLIYLILYIAMVIYTVLFTFTYLKRVLIMAFLTLISPLVALTYPIDKLRDGKAQAFDMWFKEYTFNALLQPFHLIIYSIFVSSAIDLAAKNPLFAIVALAFLTPAEKLLRKFFGFEKATTSGALGAFAGVAGGAAAFNMVSKALSHKGGGKSPAKGKGDIRTSVPDGNMPGLGTGVDTSGGANGENGDSSIRENEQPALTDEAQAWENYANTGQFWPDAGSNQTTTQSTSQLAEQSASSTGVPPTANSAQSSTSGVHAAGTAWEWSDNDNRGLGQYAGDVIKHGAGWASSKVSDFAKPKLQEAKRRISNSPAGNIGRKIAGSKIVQGGNKFVRTVGKGANTIRNFKPLANTARGVLSVGKTVGEGALRVAGRAVAAVPGAVFGMAAGIAGDDLGDIWKYTAAGGALTSATLPGMVSSAGSFISEAYRKGAQGTDEALRQQRHKEYMKSTELDAQYQHEFKHEDGSELTRAELKQMKQKGAYFNDLGFEGKDSIKAVKVQEKIKQELKDNGMEEDNADKRGQALAANIMKEVKEYSSKDLREKDTVMQLRGDLAKKCEKAGLSSKDTQDTVNMIVDGMKYIRKVHNNY